MLYSFAGKSPVIDETAFVSEQAVLVGDVEIGPRCYVGPGAIIRGDAAKIRIEERSPSKRASSSTPVAAAAPRA